MNILDIILSTIQFSVLTIIFILLQIDSKLVIFILGILITSLTSFIANYFAHFFSGTMSDIVLILTYIVVTFISYKAIERLS
jgi:hypothetical protein